VGHQDLHAVIVDRQTPETTVRRVEPPGSPAPVRPVRAHLQLLRRPRIALRRLP